MLKIISDEQISKKLTQTLIQSIDDKYKCLSNSVLIETEEGKKIIYFAKRKNTQQICLVTLSCNSARQQYVELYPLKLKNYFEFPKQLYIQLKQNKFDNQMMIAAVIDLKAQTKNQIKSVFLVNINFDLMIKEKMLEVHEMIIPMMKGLSIRDLSWYPHHPYGFLVLFSEKISYYSLDIKINQPSYQIYFRDLIDQSGKELKQLPQFVKFRFAETYREQDRYSSFGKKTTIYLISNLGNIYGISNFICNGMILDESEMSKVNQILQKPNNSRQIQIFDILKEADFIRLVREEVEYFSRNSQRKYCIIMKQYPRNIQHFIFKLTNQGQERRFEKVSLSKMPIEDFYVFTLLNKTVFITCLRNKNNQGVLKIQVISKDPYDKLLFDEDFYKASNFITETVGEVICGKLGETFLNSPNVAMKLIHPFDKVNMYLIINKTTCYRINFSGLQQLIENSNSKFASELQLIDVDVIFELKSQILWLYKTSNTIFLLRHQPKQYHYNTIPLESISLKQKIRKTNQQTQKLFDSLMTKKQNEKNKSTIIDQKINLQQLNQINLIDLENKLEKFSEDYKRSIQRKLQRIKVLYEGIRVKGAKVDSYNQDKRQIIELVGQAQKNDQRIKTLIQKSSNQRSKAQKQLQRRLNASQKFLKDLKSSIQDEYDRLYQDKEKRQIIDQCQQQADGILQCLQKLKSELINKKKQLQSKISS